MNSTHKDKLYCMTVHVLMLSDPNVASTSLVTICCFTKVSDVAVSCNRDTLLTNFKWTNVAQ